MSRRNKVLFGGLLILLVAAIAMNAYHWRQSRERDARWQEMERVRLGGSPIVEIENKNQPAAAMPNVRIEEAANDEPDSETLPDSETVRNAETLPDTDSDH